MDHVLISTLLTNLSCATDPARMADHADCVDILKEKDDLRRRLAKGRVFILQASSVHKASTSIVIQELVECPSVSLKCPLEVLE